MKIFHWIFGSFFRTIGRTIALLLMGSLLYYILSVNGFGISDLFFDKVNAEQLYVDGYDTEWYQDNARNTQLPHNNGFSYRSFSASNFNNPGYQTIDFYTKSGGVPVNNIISGEFTIPFYVSAPTIGISTTNTQQMIERTCTNFVCTNNSGTTCTQYTCNQWQNENVGSNTSSDMEYIEPVVNIQALVVYNTGYLDICSVDKNLNQIKCPVASLSNIESINFIRVIATAYYPGTTNPGNNIVVGLYRKINRYKNSTNAIIDNQNQNSQNIINQQQNSTQQMLDDNTTQAQDDAEGFFSSFSTPDVGGLSAIITAPLNTIRSLLTSTCTNLILPLPYVDEDLTLPCMNDIYTEHFGLFFTLYQTIILAIISYRCIRSVFFDIKGFSNPDDDRIEVMDL